MKFQSKKHQFRRSSIAKAAAGCPIVTELDLKKVISNCYRISPGRLEIEAVVLPAQAFSISVYRTCSAPAVTDPVEVPKQEASV
jgi:hypothetical protein